MAFRLHIVRWVLWLLSIGAVPARAQLYPTTYRPPDVGYRQLDTPHFRFIYDSTAADEVVLANDNNYPAGGGRPGAARDDTEFIRLRLASPGNGFTPSRGELIPSGNGFTPS